MLRMLVHGNGLGEVDPAILEDMFRLRHRVFKDRLGWDVSAEDGLERDRFDALEPIYLVLQLDTAVVGTVRLLRTTGPNMLRDVFHPALQGKPAPCSPWIWESTRFSVDIAAAPVRERQASALITSCLLAGIWEVGLASGWSVVVSVYDGRMARILRRAGCTIVPLGQVGQPDGTLIIAGRFPVTQAVLDRIRAVGGLDRPMLPDLAHRPAAVPAVAASS